MFTKALESSKLSTIQVKPFKISNPDSVGVKLKSKFFNIKKGDFDMWRVRNNRTMNIVFIGDKRGAGLDSKNGDLKVFETVCQVSNQ